MEGGASENLLICCWMLNSIKLLIKEFIPPIVSDGLSVAKGLRGRLALRNSTTIKYNAKHGKTIVIIGNGPSMKQSFENALSFLREHECMVVNHFADSPYFMQIKPSSYVVVDPAFSEDPDKLSEFVKNKVTKTVGHLTNDVDWELSLYLPGTFRNSFFVERLKTNKHISIVYFNNNGRTLEKMKTFYFYLLNRDMIAPLGQTVLNSCLSLSITMGYSNIFIVGADTSWHEDYWMDQETNDLYIIDKHFYGDVKRRCRIDATDEPTRIHEELYFDSIALKNYWILAEYANYNHVKVYNASSYSWIDAFERKKL